MQKNAKMRHQPRTPHAGGTEIRTPCRRSSKETALTTGAQPFGCLSLSCNRPVTYSGGMAAIDDVFRALADPSRRLLLDSLREQNGQTLRELCAGLSLARQSVSKHLAVLEAADLVAVERRGREKLHYLNADPIRSVRDGWMKRYENPPGREPSIWRHRHDALDQP